MKALQAYSISREYFRQHCLRYGTIITDVRREDETGAHRKLVINIDGWKAHISMHNGNTVAACLAGN